MASRRSRPGRRREARRRAFTLLEFVVVICIIAVLITLALYRLRELRVAAEAAAVEQMLGALRSGVAMELVSLLVQERDAEIAALAGSNPMRTMMHVPASYAGELDAPAPERMAPGRWYFDTESRLLVYRVRHGRYFESPLSGPGRARFRVRLAYQDRDGNGRFDAGLDRVQGVGVTAAEPYRWLEEPRS